MALVVSLIILVMVTLVAISGIGNVTLQQRITGHQQDRALAFQDTEAALRVAESLLDGINTHPDDLADYEDCGGTTICGPIPENTYTGTASIWQDVPQGQALSQTVTGRTPQYALQYMGEVDLPTKDPQRGSRSAASMQYSSEGRDNTIESAFAHYRITARSHDPANSDGSLVVLQSTYQVPN
ncbi:pilus assembly PilX family protein [Ectothiorhodospira marina]|uniref:Type IV pilus assembly protein PilX n=1 Tax=Ectothiorhodospira marina TaxID=1396821 RepID=A0A1H7RA30_9GAMM|nr:PilX N-terminal domain-containing pilus assembly protein [Ectothiorhodospira marina]SEL57053.1 type IV pilus assembly protein PilX [Ectothiorhodospira marina]